MLNKAKFAALVLAGTLAFGVAGYAESTSGHYDAQIQAATAKQLQNPEFKDVRTSVDVGIVTLQGSIGTYKQKLEAEKRVRKLEHVQGVRDLLQVAGTTVPDTELRDRLAKSLRYDRYGYDGVFNVLAVGVEDGVVTLKGEVREPVDRESALAIVTNTAGVKDVIDEVKVAPTSIYDDELRVRVARAIYRDPVLSRYAMDPQAPIRIVVDNGHVALYGTVANKMDSQVAYMRANSVFGAFTVENHLETSQGVAR